MSQAVILEALAARWKALVSIFDERNRRLWAGAEAHALGYGGASAVARATGLALNTVRCCSPSGSRVRRPLFVSCATSSIPVTALMSLR